MRSFKSIPALIAAIVLPMIGGAAMAASLVVDPASGQLTGARALLVGTQYYDVDFLDGTCVAMFDGCVSDDDFGFGGDADKALAAAQALLDQVLLDGPRGAFDTDPMLTFGCQLPGQCNVSVPYQVYGDATTGSLTALTIANTPDLIDPAASLSFGFSAQPTYDTDFQNLGSEVWARFTPVPLPGGLALLASGLAMFAAGARRGSRG
jgi:hypothetical protein